MTADRLDEETEARIREACGAISTRKPFTTWHPQEVHELLAVFIRAAILADREARPFRAEHRPQCTKHHCDLTSTITESWYCAVCEAAHADALAEALRGMDELVGSCAAALLVAAMHGEAGTPEVRALNTKRRDACKAALAAHDKLRGAEVRRG